MLSFSSVALSLSALVSHAEPGAAATDSDLVRHDPPPHPEIALADVMSRRDSLWLQAQGGGSFYDARRETVLGRLSPGLQFGRRYREFGVFAHIELDRSFDFTQEVKRLDVLHLGIGGEWLQFLGRVRSTASAGVALLISDTDIDNRGKAGYFVDIRPVSIRWGVGRANAIEVTPLSLDLSVPVAQGLPLLLFSYFTVVSFEWAYL